MLSKKPICAIIGAVCPRTNDPENPHHKTNLYCPNWVDGIAETHTDGSGPGRPRWACWLRRGRKIPGGRLAACPPSPRRRSIARAAGTRRRGTSRPMPRRARPPGGRGSPDEPGASGPLHGSREGRVSSSLARAAAPAVGCRHPSGSRHTSGAPALHPRMGRSLPWPRRPRVTSSCPPKKPVSI